MATQTLQILISNGTNESKGTTKATTVEGYLAAARKLAGDHFGHGYHHNILIRVGTDASEIAHEGRYSFNA